MKQQILSAILLFFSLSVIGQIPQWLIYPECDTIFVKTDGLLQGKVNGENVIWTMDGKKLFSTNNYINDFRNGIATIQNTDNGLLVGFIDQKGHFYEMPETYSTYGYPYFADGFLVTKNNNTYELYSKDGKSVSLPQLHTLYPYSNGYAPYLSFQDPQKLKKNHFNYLKPNGEPLETFVIKEKDKRKELEPKDITFISSLDDNGKAIAIIKNKLYWFDKLEMSLTPYLMGEETDKKRHLTLDSKKPIDFTSFPIDTLIIYTHYGKDQTFDLHFDNRLRLLPDGSHSEAAFNNKNNRIKQNVNTVITTFTDGKNEGLIINAKDSIPSQFEKVGHKYENKAFVKSEGKWGVLALIQNSKIDLELNDGEAIAFRHHTFPTSLKIELPSTIKSEKINIETPEVTRIHIDKASIKKENSGKNNYVIYDCTLDVPLELSDTITDISYGPLNIWLDGVRMSERNANIKGMFIKHLNISIPSNESTIENGKATFDILVESTEEGLDSLSNIEVSFESDRLTTSSEKISENVFKCTIDSLSNGVNPLIVKVAEKGCPFSNFPIEIVYSNNKKKEKVTVRQKIEAVEPEILDNLVAKEEETINPVTDNQNPAQTYDDHDFSLYAYDNDNTGNNATQTVLFNNGYMIVEVINDNAEFRAGASNDFPTSSIKDSEIGKTNKKYPHKGQMLIAKEVKDWYKIHPNFFNQKNTDPKYISGIDVRPLKSKTFKLNEITKPVTFVKANKETNEFGETGYFAETIVIYPGGIFVMNKDSFWTSNLCIGTFADGQPALLIDHQIESEYEYDRSNEKEQTMRLIDGKNADKIQIHFELPSNEKKYIKINEINIPYPNLSKFNEDEWRSIIQKIALKDIEDKNRINFVESLSDIVVVTKDMLDKNYIKN